MPLFNAAGLVEPPSYMLDRLKQIDPHFGLLFGYKSGTWWITLDWEDNDPRRQFVRRGEVSPQRAYDMFCQLPADCSADDAFGYLVRVLKRNAGKDGIQRLLDRVDAYNKKQQDELLRPGRELAEELIATNAKTLFSDMGKTVGRTKAPVGKKNLDAVKLRDYLHDHAGTN